MRILLTGASGFLGTIIYKVLAADEVITLSRRDANVVSDLSIEIPTVPKCDLVIHAAGKAHSVPQNETQEREFFLTNVQGTLNLLRGIEKAGLPEAFVFISTIAVYGNTVGKLIAENENLGAGDPYGRSKVEAEHIIQDWCKVHHVKCTIFRLPLIAGPNPPGNLRAMIAGIKRGYYVNIDGGNAKKSMVLAEDVASIIIKASQIGGIYNLTDSRHPTFAQLAVLISKQLHKGTPKNIPISVAKILARVGDLIGPKFPINSNKLEKISSDLTFDDSKAQKLLGWNPKSVLEGFQIE